MSPPTLRSVRRAIPRHLFVPNDRLAASFLARVVLLLTLCSAASYATWEAQLWWLYPLNWIATGTVLFGLFEVAHNCGHHAKVELHILEVDEGIDMDEDKIDIAIQVLPPSKWELQGVRSSRALTRKSLGQLPLLLCVSPQYLERHGPIQHPSQLQNHRCIVQGANPSARFVRFRHGDGTELEVEVSMGIFTTSVAFCKRAALEGIGPAGLTRADCQRLLDRGELVHILQDWETERVRCVAAFVEGPRPPRRIRAFLDLFDELFTLS